MENKDLKEAIDNASKVIKEVYSNSSNALLKLRQESDINEYRKVARELNTSIKEIEILLDSIVRVEDSKSFLETFGFFYITAKTKEWKKVINGQIDEKLKQINHYTKENFITGAMVIVIGITSFYAGFSLNKTNSLINGKQEVRAYYEKEIAKRDANYKALLEFTAKDLNSKDKEIEELKKKVRR